jgi:8-oxo-dGTP pyrophosphatase MutT (NUDIX family)
VNSIHQSGHDDSSKTGPKFNSTRRDHSSGGVAYSRTAEGEDYQVALIATRGWKRWQLPKGSVEPQETSEQAAIREVEEEVGLHTTPEKFLRTIEYWYWDTYRRATPELVHKTVDFYLLRVVSGAISDASHEVDGAAWFDLEQAIERLTFQGEAEVVRLALAALNGQDEEAN